MVPLIFCYLEALSPTPPKKHLEFLMECTPVLSADLRRGLGLGYRRADPPPSPSLGITFREQSLGWCSRRWGGRKGLRGQERLLEGRALCTPASPQHPTPIPFLHPTPTLISKSVLCVVTEDRSQVKCRAKRDWGLRGVLGGSWGVTDLSTPPRCCFLAAHLGLPPPWFRWPGRERVGGESLGSRETLVYSGLGLSPVSLSASALGSHSSRMERGCRDGGCRGALLLSFLLL